MQYAAKCLIITGWIIIWIIYLILWGKALPVNKNSVWVIEHVSYYTLQIGYLLKVTTEYYLRIKYAPEWIGSKETLKLIMG